MTKFLVLLLVIANVVNTPTKFKKSEVKQILDKLDKCYNINNDPRSDEYKKRRLEQFQTLTDYETKNLVIILLILFNRFRNTLFSSLKVEDPAKKQGVSANIYLFFNNKSKKNIDIYTANSREKNKYIKKKTRCR